ncbi:D-alanyl-D-alanine carboxypeptidase/D-alanyl-D-alanine-endopeptidase [Prevotella melaninogenica]|uniref:D-alanyl-D-alanine carboxypeptidase/D-alanyl-D-alanine endopeptidase n=1 Tax=Prevotella TaxID=838 RepID=UPI0003AD4503|nr:MULTISPECIES: D-alanyl-D-alanine carboxypeptidase/D-alanyl-D-alanine-endopeptidase [Prevotella]ERJ78989.1 D-alanyl-D-alanine carboxypeptidase/D-alanyl-D-alanine-endopeptidase [Prevotella sp. F0091]QUB73963.1 D-alanyl-D-alanine carboxypeptidase/D-alanyl-D-alanine-endopeptidase [Prevotella melaninogenica]
MRLKYLSALVFGVILSLPTQAQVYLDSTEVANILHPKAVTVVQTKVASVANDDNEEEEDTDSIIPAFATDSRLSWKENITARLDGILRSPLLETVQTSLMVWDLTDDVPVYQFRERLHLRPASTMKCFTAIATLDKLGADYDFKTRIYYMGEIDDSTQVLRGDLYCVGGMDPMFSSSDMIVLARAVRDQGIKGIEGNIYADLSFKDRNRLGEGWCWDDKNPNLSPLLIDRKDDFIYRFSRQLEEMGVTLNGSTGERQLPTDAQLLTTCTHSIRQVLHRMMKQSDNLYAESMFYQLAANGGTRWASAKMARQYENALFGRLGLNPRDYNVADGSGLSLYNYVSTELEVKLLRYAYQRSDIYDAYLEALPIASVDGTLKKRMRGTAAAGNVRAKTGTVKGVSSLAGYLTASNGHLLCFSIINNGGLSNGPMRNLQNKICVALCQ